MTGFTQLINLFDCWHVKKQMFFQYEYAILEVISTIDGLKNIYRVFRKFAYGIPFLIQGTVSKLYDRKDQIAVQRLIF